MSTELQSQLIDNLSKVIGEEIDEKHDDIDLIKYEIEKRAETYRVMGRTINEWIEHFTIRVTYPATPQDVMRYCSEIVAKNDEAYRYLAKMRQQYKVYLMSYLGGKGQEISRLANNKSRKVMPAADTLEKVAEAQMGIRNDILVQYEKDIDFFQSMIYKLNKTLESVKIIGMSIGTQLKGELGYQ